MGHRQINLTKYKTNMAISWETKGKSRNKQAGKTGNETTGLTTNKGRGRAKGTVKSNNKQVK